MDSSTPQSDNQVPTQGNSPADMPAPVVGGGSGVSGGGKFSKELLIKIGVIAGAVILLIVAAVLAFSQLGSASREDYISAGETYSSVSSANSIANTNISILNSGIGTDTDAKFNEEYQNAESALADLKTKNEEFGKEKAFNVGEGKTIYDEFDKKLNEFIAYAEEVIASAKAMRPAMVVCNKVNETTEAEARVVALKECATALDGVKDSISESNAKTYITALATEYSNYANVQEKINAMNDPYGDQFEEYKTLREQRTATQTKINDVRSDYSSANLARNKEVSPKDAADALRDFLNKKMNES